MDSLGLVYELDRPIKVAPPCADESHNPAPSVRVLRQPEILAKLLASPDEFEGRRHIVPLQEDLAHPHEHVGCAPEDARFAGGQLETVLESRHRLAEVSLGELD